MNELEIEQLIKYNEYLLERLRNWNIAVNDFEAWKVINYPKSDADN